MVEREQRPGGQEKQSHCFVSHEGISSGKEKSSLGVQAAHPLPSRSSLTDFPDLTRFPDTFGYPAIWGGSGKDEPPPAEGAEDEPSEARRTVGEWSALTKTWNNISKETVMKIRARTPEERTQWEQIILEDMRLMEQVEEERSPETDAEDEAANEQARKSWEELFAKEGIDMLAYMREGAENAPRERPVQLGIEDIDQWELMLLHLPDAALDRIIQSFPEFEDAPASLIRLVIAEVDQRSRHRRAGKPPSSTQN